MKMSKHAQERCQQRGVSAIAFELAVYAEVVRASNHAELLYFNLKSFQRMHADGVSKEKICMLEKKKHLRLIASGNVGITCMYANQRNKRIQHHER